MRYLLYAAAVLAMSVATVACGDDEEQLPAPSQTATASPASSATPPPTAPPMATATPASNSADWKTYSDPGGLFTLRYPPNWFQSPGQAQFSSYDLSTLTTITRPPEAVVVEMFYRQAAGSDTCGGILSVNPKSGENIGPLPGATPTVLGGLPAWQLVRLQGDPAISEEDLTRIDRIAAIHKGYCLFVTAYYTQQNPDVAIFLQIASTFEFQS